jgi:FlaA1/EpsC-like NDP-sugar epimerase
MRRYFMTIPEASQLVMQAGAIGRGGEIFVLDMGEQVRILDLARELIRRNGLEPERDIELRFTGVRPGEKLYEELACDDEQTRPTSHPKIRVWELPAAWRDEVERGLKVLGAATMGSNADAVAALRSCVPEYLPGEAEKARAKARLPLRLVKDDPAVETAAA